MKKITQYIFFLLLRVILFYFLTYLIIYLVIDMFMEFRVI